MDIREQIEQLLAGEGRYLSVHQQWEVAQSLKKLLAVYEAAQEVMPIIDRNQVAVNKLREALSRV